MSNAKLCLKSYQPQTDAHQHNFHQLVLPVSGTLALEIGTTSGQVCAQQAAIICASEKHVFEGQGDNQFIVADIPIQLAPAFSKLPMFISLDDNINRYIHFLQGQLNLPRAQHNQLLQRQMLLLLVQLLDDRHSQYPLFDKRVETARRYLEQHFCHKQVLQEAASHAGLSPRHLRQLFSQYYALAPSQYVLELKMQAAWQLLNNSTLSIQQISERCGYSNISAFSDRFQKHFSHCATKVRRFSK